MAEAIEIDSDLDDIEELPPPQMDAQAMDAEIRRLHNSMEAMSIQLIENTQCLLFRRLRLDLQHQEKPRGNAYRPSPIETLVLIPREIPHDSRKRQRDPRTGIMVGSRRVSSKRRRRQHEKGEIDEDRHSCEKGTEDTQENIEIPDDKTITEGGEEKIEAEQHEVEMTDQEFEAWLLDINSFP